jgi:rhamnose utilization protein RhaD (predicted bifunctional aldolase and dehydrogenase)
MSTELEQLIAMTRTLGEPQRELVIIGEGNTSCKIDDDSLWIKASGHGMETIGAEGLVAVKTAPILEMLANPPATLTEEMEIRKAAKVDPESPLFPSQEVSFHALLIHECGAKFVGHTHPIAINRVMCSTRAEQFAKHRIFPDQVVVCGAESVFLPYADPGLPLALVMQEHVREFMDRTGAPPRTILLASHGFIALGQTPGEVLNITAMMVKAASVFEGACNCGGPVFMPPEEVAHINKRPDELYRRSLFKEA